MSRSNEMNVFLSICEGNVHFKGKLGLLGLRFAHFRSTDVVMIGIAANEKYFFFRAGLLTSNHKFEATTQSKQVRHLKR